MPLAPYLWMLLGAMAFAAMGTLAHALAPYCDWHVVALTRTTLALAFGVAMCVSAGVKLVIWRPATLWIRSIAGSISLVAAFYALPRLPVGDVLTLTNVFPLWIALLSWPLLGERPTKGVWLAIVSGLAGVALIQQPHLTEGNLASLVALGSSFSTAVAMIGLHRLKGIDARAIVVHFSAVSVGFCLVPFVASPELAASATALSPTALWMLLGVGLTATAGQLMLTKAFVAGAPAKVSVVGLTQVGFGLFFDILIEGRDLDAVTLVGTALVVAPTAWVLLSQRISAPPQANAGTQEWPNEVAARTSADCLAGPSGTVLSVGSVGDSPQRGGSAGADSESADDGHCEAGVGKAGQRRPLSN